MLSTSLRSVIVGMCAALVAISWVGVRSLAAASVTLANGTWTVEGREIPGTRCGHWLVRLTSMQGRLSGVVSLARSSVPIQNLVLLPDGAFSGTTQASISGARHVRAYRITGRFSGDTVRLTLENDVCPARHGMAARQPARR
jgi:hypothetical protein